MTAQEPALYRRLPLTNRSTLSHNRATVEELAAELKALLTARRCRGHMSRLPLARGLIGLFFAQIFPRTCAALSSWTRSVPQSDEDGRLWPLYLSVLNPSPERQPIASLKQAMSETVEMDISIEQVKRHRR